MLYKILQTTQSDIIQTETVKLIIAGIIIHCKLLLSFIQNVIYVWLFDFCETFRVLSIHYTTTALIFVIFLFPLIFFCPTVQTIHDTKRRKPIMMVLMVEV